MSTLVVLACGPGTTLQDAGRFGWQRFGIGPSGAMDLPALARANLLVGNGPGAAALEFALVGGTLRLEDGPARVAFVGTDAAVTVEGRAVPPVTSVTMRPGETLRIGAARRGVFGYLAVAGGFALEPALGSLSFHLRSGLGGIGGRPPRPGDRLGLRRDRVEGPDLAGPMEPAPAPRPLGVMPGPQDDYFTAAGLETFLGSAYTITPQADRMGYRLAGPRIEHGPAGFNIVSDGIATGAIQVPGSGEPIILMADRQTTGGYPKIATVITADLGRLAQTRPGAALTFRVVDRTAALVAARQQAAATAAFRAAMRPAGAIDLDSTRLLGLNLVDGVVDGLELPPL